MAVNMSKNCVELMAAYREVVDARSDVNWLLLTYEGNSNTIRLAGKGGGGLEEMVDELSSGKVMYAFCRVRHPDSGLPKYVLVNWTGEGAKETRKGLCANHLGTIANFLKGAHVTVNARDEDDVDPGVIMSKVSKASGSSGADYDFRRGGAPQAGDVPRGTVGSVYRKTNAREEIQQIDKDSFWMRTQREEEVRRQEEVKKAELQRRAVEKERSDLEEKHTKEREQKIHQRNNDIDQNRFLQKKRDEEDRAKDERQQNLEIKDGRTTGVKLPASVYAANEAKTLISQRAFHPRDVFQPHKSIFDGANGSSAPAVGKLRSPFLSQQGFDSPLAPPDLGGFRPASVPRAETPPAREEFRVGGFQPASVPRAETPPTREEFRVIESAGSPSPPSPSPQLVSWRSHDPPSKAFSPVAATRDAAEDDDWSDEFDEELYAAPTSERLKSLTETMFPTPVEDNQYKVQRNVEPELYEDIGQHAHMARDDDDNNDRGALQNQRARAVYDYQAADDTEITFDPDDVITGIEMVDEGWWRGYGPDGHFGMFPANYVELL
ncbi:drebrin-like protein B [Stigmatopora argus]